MPFIPFIQQRNTPHSAMIPLVILWFGIGDPARIFSVAIGVLFLTYINTFYAIRSIDPGLIEMGKVYGLRSKDLLWQIILLTATGSLGARISHASPDCCC